MKKFMFLNPAEVRRTILWIILSLPLSVAEGRGLLRVVATTEDLAAIAHEVGGDKTEVVPLIRGTQDPHYIQVRPSDMIKVSRADLFAIVGLELDQWAYALAEGARNPGVMAGAPGFVDCSKDVHVLEVPIGKVDRSMGDVHPLGNPHYWLDPENGKVIAKNILDGLQRVDPQNAGVYQKNHDAFCAKLDRAIAQWKEIAAPLKGKQVITYHKSWSYFLNAFGMQASDYVEPRAGVPPSPKHVQDLISKIRARKISLLLVDPYFDIRLPQKIEAETDADLVILAPSVGAIPAVKDYIGLFEYNLDRIVSEVKP